MKNLWCFLILGLCWSKAYADHYFGSSLSYRCLGNDQYEVTLRVYTDCDPNTLALPPDHELYVRPLNPLCAQSVQGFTAYLDTVGHLSQLDVSQTCAASTCAGGTMPGVQQYLYRGILTLAPGCIWEVAMGGCCRARQLTNIQTPFNQGVYVPTIINTQLNTCNNSPQFANRPLVYACDSTWSFYNHGATDPDGDSLIFSLIPPQSARFDTVDFIPGLSYTQPLSVQGGTQVSLDSTTGQLSFMGQFGLPQIVILAIKVEEIRNGVVIGYTVREVQIVVQLCNNQPPDHTSTTAISNIQVSSLTEVQLCRGAVGTFSVLLEDPDGNPLTVSTNGAIAVRGGTVTYAVNNTNPAAVRMTFTVDATQAITGTYPISILATDNSCPINASQSFALNLTILGVSYRQSTYCTSDPDPLPTVVGGATGVYREVSGTIGLALDSLTGAIDLSASAPGIYQVLFSALSGNSCPKDTLQVTISAGPDAQFGYPQTIWCHQGSNPIPNFIATVGGQFFMSSGGSVGAQTGIVDLANTTVAATHRVYHDVSLGNCRSIDYVDLTITGPIVYPADTFCTNAPDPTPVVVGDSGGTFVALPPNAASLALDPMTGYITLNASQPGNYRVLYQRPSGLNCDGDTTTITIIQAPSAQFSYTRPLWCREGSNPVPTLTGTPGGAFYAFNGVILNFGTGEIDLLNSPFGDHTIYYQVDSGGCVAIHEEPLTIMGQLPLEALADRYYLCGNRWDTIALSVAPNYRGTRPPLGQFQWSPATGLDQPTSATPIAILRQAQTYTVTYTDGYCPPLTDTVSLAISYPAQLYPLQDQVMCETDSVQLGAAVFLQGNGQYFSNSTMDSIPMEDTSVFTLQVSGVFPNQLDATLLTSLEICMDFDINSWAHLTIYLIAPSGEILVLSQNNGGFNTSLRGGTFSEDRGNRPIVQLPALTPIIPNQSYYPQAGAGGFGVLQGATANGTWRLMIIHDNNGISIGAGTFYSWCMNFRDLSTAQFDWSPNNYLSCTPCDSPWVSPPSDQSYTVIATNLVGCQDTGTVQVTVDTLIAAPMLSCEASTLTTTTIGWLSVPQAVGYRVQVDGGPWQLLGMLTDSFQVTGLQPGNCATVIVQTLGGTRCVYGKLDTIVCCAQDCGGIGLVGLSTNAGGRFCQGQAALLWADTNYISYQWSTGDSTRLISVTQNGYYTVTVTDQWGCQDTAGIQAQVVLPLSLGLTDSSSICAGDSILVQLPTGAVSYQWSHGLSGMMVWLSQSGLYMVTVTDTFGCLSLDTTVLQVRTPVQLTWQVQPPRCAPPQATDGRLSVQVRGGSGSYHYQWSTGDTTSQALGLGIGRYCLTVTDTIGCQADSCVELGAPPPLQVQWDTVPVRCAGGTDGQLTAIASGGVGGYRYQWLPNGPLDSTYRQLAAGPYAISISDANGCTDTFRVMLTEPMAPQLVGSAEPARCHGTATGSVQVGATGGTGPWQYQWSTGSSDTLLQGVVAGMYCVTATDVKGCTLDTCLLVQQPTALGLSTFVGQEPSCHGGSNGQATVLPLGASPPYRYQWSTTPLQTNATATGLRAGLYQVTITDAQGCELVGAITLGQPSSLQVQSKVVQPTLCALETGSIQVQFAGGNSPYTYQWNNGSQDSGLVQLGAGWYVVTVTDGQGCTLIDSSEVGLDFNGLRALGFAEATRCIGEANGLIEGLYAGGTFPSGRRPTYRLLGVNNNAWQFYGGFVGLPAGTYTLEVRDGVGCIADTQLVVPSGASFYLQAMLGDTTVEYLDPVTVYAQLNDTQGVQYQWTVQTGNSDALPPNAGYSFNTSLLHTTQYRFRAVSPLGCVVDSMVWVKVHKPRRANAPLAFTPNGDGVNDRFFIQGGKKAKQVLLMRVYDRWGSLLFEGRDIPINGAAQGWDGVYKGQDVTSGVYVWYAEVLYIDGYVELLKGDVQVIR